MGKKMSAYSMAIYTTVTPSLGGVVIVLNIVEIILLLRKSRRNMTMALTYILSLSISDLMVGIVMIILKSMDPFMKTTFKGNVVAKESYDILKHCFIRLSLFVSIFNLMALTFDRVVAIVKPFLHRKLSRSFSTKVCILVWITSVTCVAIVYCVSRFHLSDVERYNNLVFPISTYTTTAVFIVCYAMIYREIRASRTNRRKSTMKSKYEQKDTPNESRDSMKQEVGFKFIIIAPVGIAPESNAEEALLDGSGGRNIRSVVGKNRDFSQNFFRFVRPS